MFAPETAETTDLKHCQACSAAQITRDKFCRRCGARQCHPVDAFNSTDSGVASDIVEGHDRSGSVTASLPASETLRRSYSGRLVGVVIRELSVQTSSVRASRWMTVLICMLVATPLWLMIVLLSPLDAYVAAKDLAKQA
jgi:hypothetical protein